MLIGNTSLQLKSEAQKRIFVPVIWDGIVIGLIAISAIANAEIFSAISILHYALYFVPLVLVSLWFIYPSCRHIEQRPDRKFVWLMLLSLITPALLSKDFQLQYIVFMWWGFLPFAFPMRLRPSLLIWLFLTLSVCQLTLSAMLGFSFKRFDVDSLSSGSAALTHTLPVTFGVLFGALIRMRQYTLVLMCIAMILVAGKRSVLMASAFSFGIMMLREWSFRSSKKGKDSRIHFSLILPFTFCAMIISLLLPTIYEHISSYFGLNINIMTSGRYEGQSIAYSTLFHSDIFSLLFGRGLGQVDEYAVLGFHGATTLIHNDYMRLFIDLGLISTFLYVFSFIHITGKGTLGIYLVVFEEYCWLTENNLIFIMLPILFYICLSCASNTYSSDSGAIKIKTPSPLHPAFKILNR